MAGVLIACGGAPPPSAGGSLGDLRFSEGFAYEPIIQASGAAYIRIENRGTLPDTLLEASSPAATGAMFHGGSMTHMMVLPIPAAGELRLEPGGTHIMLQEFTVLPRAGDSLAVTLRFARAGSVTLKLPIRLYGTP
jgi:copper(I)-binding protein